MKAFKCDRCGKHYIENDDKWTEPLIYRVSWNYHEIDLCDDCLEELQTWVTCLGKLQTWIAKYRKENGEE